MLSVHPQARESFPPPFRHLELTPPASPSAPSFYHPQSGMGGGYPPKSSSLSQQAPAVQTAEDIAVAQALEMARENPDDAQDPAVYRTLVAALERIWAKVQAQPDSYVMTRDEFAIFNFYQHCFVGNKMAVAARKRYWDNITASAV